MNTPTEFCLPALNKHQKSRLLKFVLKVLQAQQSITDSEGKNILHHTLENQNQHIKMNHYPKGDRIDFSTGAQYFYHCHREDLDSMEHGHFHCFLRYNRIPSRIKPVLFAPDGNSPMTHLTSIAMNRFGQPIRLFTVNHWVSAEVWYPSRHMPSFVRRFKMTLNDNPHWQIMDQWVEGILQIFQPQIAWLHQMRDLKIEQNKKHPEHNVYEDREIEELSSIQIDLHKQIEWLMEPH